MLSGSYGLPKPWYFPVTSSYWCGGSHHDSSPKSSPRSCRHGNNGDSTAGGTWRRLLSPWQWRRRSRAAYGDLLNDDEDEEQACAMGGGQGES